MTLSQKWMTVAAAALAALAVWHLSHRHARIRLGQTSPSLPADGRVHKVAILYPPRWQSLHADDVQSSPSVFIRPAPEGIALEVFLRAPVFATRQTLRLTWRANPLSVQTAFKQDDQPSSAAPGLPDWMPLHTATDRASFRRWFTTLADRAADAPATDLPPEIADCAALLRYSFREALHIHDDAWYAHTTALERLSVPSVTQWSYPSTPLHAALFRTRSGVFTPGDLADGTFAQFADARTLTTANTFLVSRNLQDARPGDLIFFRLLELDSHHHSQYHSMIVTGEHAEWVVYHTGPVSATDGREAKGEMRRVLLKDLLHHPDPRWRPQPANGNFLGVYRWDILAEGN